MCVASFGESKDFPAFFTPRSGFQAPYHVTSPKQAAEMIGETGLIEVDLTLMLLGANLATAK